MKKEADRIRRWRERKKAEGKSSFTVVLSQQAREILAEEKGKTGESYAVIMEKALLGLKRQGYTPPVLRHFPRREEVLARASAQNPPPAPAAGRKGDQPRILIDDLANYPSLEDIDVLLLACTHYPLIRAEIESHYGGTVRVLDATEYTARALRNALADRNQLSAGKKEADHFYVSDYSENFARTTRLFYTEKTVLERCNIWNDPT